MAKYSNTVHYNIETTLDSSGVAQLQAQIRQVETELQRMANQQLIEDKVYNDAKTKLEKLRSQINMAFNSNLGMLDTKKLTDGLKNANLSLGELRTAFSTAGTAGEMAFNNTISRLGKLDTGIKSISRTTDKLFNTIGNTVRWGVVASGFQGVLNSAHQAVQYVRDLDTSLTNIMMVTDYSKEQMYDYANAANEAAKNLSSTTVAMTDATLVFAQQGFDLPQASQLAEMSTTLANVSQQDTATTSDQITAYMNAYGMDDDMEQLQGALDSWAKVANVSAADVEELATATQKAASTANTVGVNMDQLAAQIATIQSVTREAPENIGNGLKTIYARMSDIGMGETLDDGVNLGQVTQQLEQVGVAVLDSEGKMRNVGDIMEDLMGVWSSMDTTQKAAVGATLAGKYQLSRFEALMNRSDLYTEYKDASLNANGEMEKMQDVYADSLEGRINKLQATLEGVFNDLFNSSDFYGMIDALTTVLDLTNQFVDAIGGGTTALTGLGAVATKVFSNNIASGLNNFISNRELDQQKQNNQQNARLILEDSGLSAYSARNEKVLKYIQDGLNHADTMTDQQMESYNANIERTLNLKNEELKTEQEILAAVSAVNAAYRMREEIDPEGNKNQDAIQVSRDEEGRLQLDTRVYDTLGIEDIESLQNLSQKAIDERYNLLGKGQKGQEGLQLLSAITNTSQNLSLFETGKVGFDKIAGDLKEIISLGTQLERVFGKNSSEAKLLEQSFEQVREAFNGIKTDSSEQEIDSLKRAMTELQLEAKKALEAANSGTVLDIDAFTELQNRQIGNYARTNAQEEVNAQMTQSLMRQEDINNIVTASGAVGQLAFSWQSFQSLGSLWVNADLDTGEKLTQTVMNLLVNLPMLISGFADFNNFAKSNALGDIADSLASIGESKIDSVNKSMVEYWQALDQGGAAAVYAAKENTKNQTAISLTGRAAQGASVALRGLNSVLSLLGGPVGMAAFAAFTLISTALSAIDQQKTQQFEELKTSIEDFSSATESISSFSNLYQNYLKGEASTEELKNSADSLNKTLEDQALKTYAAAGAWGEYYKRLQEVNQEQINTARLTLQDAENTAEEALKSSGGQKKDAKWTTPNDKNTPREFYSEDIQSSASAVQINSMGEWTFASDATVQEKIDSIEYLNNKYSELLSAMSEEDPHYQNAVNFVDGFRDWSSQYSEQINAVNSAAEGLNAATLQAYKDDSAYQYTEGLSIEDYKQQLRDTGQFQTEEMLNSFVQGMANANVQGSEELAKALAQEQAQTSFGQGLYTKLEADLQTEDSSIAQQLRDSGIDINNEQLLKPITDVLVSKVIEQVNNSSLSENDKLALMNGIDWSQPIEDILATVSHSVETGNLDSIDVEEYEKTDNQEGKQILSEKYEVDDSTLDAYEEQLKMTTEMGQAQQDLANDLKDAEKQYGKQSEEAENARKELEQYNDAIDDIATESARCQKGIESLSESFEDNYDILKNGDKTSLEYAEALGETKDAMADVLNVSSEDLSNDFIEKNLDDINALANGDMEALERLRTAAAQDYVVNLNTQGNLTDENLNFLQQHLAQIDAMNIQPGAYLDDKGFIDGLNSMLSNGQMTVDQVNTMFSMMGYNPTISWKTERKPVFDLSDYSVKLPDPLGEIHLPQIQIMGNVQVPVIEGGSDGGTAPKKVYSSGGSSGKGSSGSSGGGGGGRKGRGGSGGGGGSGSSYEPKKKDSIEEEIDRYERVDTMIDAIANDLDRVAEEQDRLAGFEVIDNMEKQIELIQRQIELQKEKLSIQQQEQKELRKSLASDYGIQFDSEGFITNYAQIHQKLTDEVNRLINKYNSTTTESGQESLEKQIEKAQDKLDDFKDDYQRYDELVSNDMKDTLQTLEDLEDQIEDIRIEAFQTSVEAADNIKDIQEALNEFNQVFSGLSSDDPFRQMALSVANLTDYFDVATTTVNEFYDELIARTQEQMGASGVTEAQKKYLQSQIDLMEEAQASFGNQTMEEYGTGYLDLAMTNLGNILDQINQYEQNGVSSIFGENAGDLYETAKDVFDQTTEMIEDYESEIDDLRDAILDAIDEIADQMDRRVEQYENITDELEHQRDIIELIHGDEAYTQLNEALAAQQHNYRAQINEMQQQLDIWKDMQSAMEEGSEEWLAIQELITDTQSDLNDLVQESLENLQEQYENTVNNIMNSWVDSALGTDLDWMNDQWELINRNADYYLDDVNAAYEIQKLQGDYLELLDGSNDVKIQQMITEQMKQQLGYLRDKEKLSEYDVAYAQAQLEILQKRIALEEAQRNKSQMKLRRDSQGNYSYVYTADEGDVASAQEGLLDAQNNAYNLSKDQMKQTQDDSLSALSDAQQMLNDIWTNANLTLEEKQERTRTIIDSLKEYLAGTSEQLSTSEKNIINDFIGMVEMMTDENGERLDDVYNQIINGNLDAFDQIDTRWSTSLTQWLQNLENFNASTDDMFGNLVDNANDYQDQIDEVGDLVETDFNDMSDSIQNAVDKTNDLSNSTSDFINQLKNDSGTIKEYENILQDYADKISDVTNEMRAYQEQVNDLADKLTAKEQENANLQTQIKDLQNQINGSSGGSGGSGGSSFGGSGYSKNDLAWGIAQNIWTYGTRGGWGNDPTRSSKLTKAYGSDFARQVQSIINQNYRSEKLVNFGSKKFSSYNLLGYDTGGYTGSWSDGDKDAKNGKLAYLHQKELVLNESDTKNLLNAVDIVRQLTQSLKSSALQESITNLSVLKTPAMGEKKIKQDVHITAEFPNANSASEIEQALLSLNDRAIQYSFKK